MAKEQTPTRAQGYTQILFKKKWPKSISLKKTRESTDDRNRHPRTRVDPNKNTRLPTYPIKVAPNKISHVPSHAATFDPFSLLSK